MNPGRAAPGLAGLRGHAAARAMLVFALVALAWDAVGADLQVMQLWGTAQGFALKNNPWLSVWLHDRGKQLAVLVFLALLVQLVWPLGPWKRLTRSERTGAVLAVFASLAAVALLKRYSLTSCPWELQIFGGVAQHISHWQWGVADGGGGRCFPGGHASAALGLMPASLPFWLHPDADLRKTGRRLFLLTLGAGLVFGMAQTLRGAHYPSHTLWTACICWTVGVAVYLALQGRARRRALSPR